MGTRRGTRDTACIQGWQTDCRSTAGPPGDASKDEESITDPWEVGRHCLRSSRDTWGHCHHPRDAAGVPWHAAHGPWNTAGVPWHPGHHPRDADGVPWHPGHHPRDAAGAPWHAAHGPRSTAGVPWHPGNTASTPVVPRRSGWGSAGPPQRSTPHSDRPLRSHPRCHGDRAG